MLIRISSLILFPNYPLFSYDKLTFYHVDHSTMKTLLPAAILLLLQGCIYQSVDEIDIKIANEKCKNNQGVASINIYAGVSTSVLCKDGINQSFSPIAKDLYIKNKVENLAPQK